eukprot:scaffold12256_cov97-Isochrysis_galbana.AAC.1
MPESAGAPLAAATRPANASRPAATTTILPTRPFSAATFSTPGLASTASPARGASMAICSDKGANPPILDDDGAVVSICGGNGAIPSVCAGNGAIPPLGDKGTTLSACGANGASPAICGNKGASPPHCGGIRAFSPTRSDEGACWNACGDIGASPSVCGDKGATPSICSTYPAATATCVKQTACSISGRAIDDAMGANSHSGKAACLQVRVQLDPPSPLEIGSPGWEVNLRLEGLSFSVASTHRTPSADAPASHPPSAPSPPRTPAAPPSPAASPPPSAAVQHAPGTPTSLPWQARAAWVSSHTPFTAAAPPPPPPPREGISSARNVGREPDGRESAEREWPCLPKPPAAPARFSRHGTPLLLAPSLSCHGSPLAPAHASRRTSPAAVGDSSATYETVQDSSPPYPILDAAPSYPYPFGDASPPYPFSDGTGSPRGPLLESPPWPARQGADPGEGCSLVPHPAARGDELSASVALTREFLFVERQAQWRATAGAPAGLQGLCAGGGGGTRGALVGEVGTGGRFAGEAAGEGGAAASGEAGAATQAAGGLRFLDWPPLPSPRNSLCWSGVRCSVTSPPSAPQAVAPAPPTPPAATVQLPPAGKNRHGDRNWPIDRNSLSGPNLPADKVGYADQNRRADPNRPADQNRPSEQQSRPQDPNKPADENGPADQNSPGPGAGSRRVRGGVARPAWVDLRPTASSVTDRWLRPEARRRESSASAGRDRTSPARDAISPSRTCISFGRDRISLGRHGISPSRESRPAERDTTRIPPPPRTKARQMKPGPTDPGETKPGQTGQTKPAETRPGETKPGLVPSAAAAGSARRSSSLVAPPWAAPSIHSPALGRGASPRPHPAGCANPMAQPAVQTRGQATSTSAAGDLVSPGQSPRGGARCGGSSQRARGGAAAGAPAATEHSATTKAKDVFKRAGGA